MKFSKVLIMGTLGVFSLIGFAAVVKKISGRSPKSIAQAAAPQLDKLKASSAPAPKVVLKPATVSSLPIQFEGDFPLVDRIAQLFTTGPTKLPIVETVTYSSQVSWLKGRPAWIADYAAYYGTSRHFIARSLNGKPDYETQRVSPGSQFNVFRKDRNFQFYLLADLTHFKMGLYYIDLDTNERVLIKTYRIGVGKISETGSGSLTPLGTYTLGGKIAIYKPGTIGEFQGKQMQMIRVFGTRWIPFDQEIEGCTAPAKGYGIHGAPWEPDRKGNLVERKDSIGHSDSDGCIRLATEDVEELFSIVITKPTVVRIVNDIKDAKLPGVEVSSPMR